MVIFHSYFELPEGKRHEMPWNMVILHLAHCFSWLEGMEKKYILTVPNYQFRSLNPAIQHKPELD